MKKIGPAIYLIVSLLLCILPFAGLLWNKSSETTENRTLTAFPQLSRDGTWNLNFLAEAGDYFEDHFAYRQELVTADALLRGELLGTSASDSVIKGTDGWLYYKDSLDDFLGNQALSDRGIFDIAHTLKMMQDYVENSGRKFLFTVAPNKNSLYGEHMPYYYQIKVSDGRNIDKLKTAMESEGVNYVDLYGIFEYQDDTLYHRRDSHWNNKGAALAAETLLDAADHSHRFYGNAEFEIRRDFEGDLDKMLYPLAVSPEEEIYYKEPFTYEYEEPVESNYDPEIKTVCASGTGSLLMYRDSFGNALLPFMAEEFATARFSRGVPYYLDDMYFSGADTVIVERAERFLPDMAENPPVAQSPSVTLDLTDFVDAGESYTACTVSQDGFYLKFAGTVDESLMNTETEIYLRLDREETYEAYPMIFSENDTADDCGYVVYLRKENLEDTAGKVELFLKDGMEIRKIYQASLDFNIDLYE